MAREMQYLNRVIGEIELLSTHFGDIEYDPDYPIIVMVLYFNLPFGFNRQYSKLLIEIDKKYPQYPPKNFYLDQGLRKNGKTPSHYYEGGFPGKKYCRSGYAWYCLHIESWRPDSYSMVAGDNLLTAVEAVYNALST